MANPYKNTQSISARIPKWILAEMRLHSAITQTRIVDIASKAILEYLEAQEGPRQSGFEEGKAALLEWLEAK